ncbi:putative zinc-type alcohol dehydrogenase-like protein [Leptodontidium sp. 2 PMI_412]|nr:putative zinc-type alcohol dehydrogenase-like protein [Leptodontidium sp. 2 PMI_412]
MALSYQINVIDLSHSHLSPTLLSNLSVKEIPIPIPGPTSVVVRIRAAALNFRDLLCLADSPLYPVRTPPGLVPLDMHNILGSGVVNGTLSQYVVVEDPWLIRAPKNLSFEESAALPGAAGTAMNVLESISIGGNTTVVTQGTGGVSCAVIQYAAALGARVIATSSTDEKLQVAKKLGASELINYKTIPDWADEVLRLTGGKGADLVCDVGGSGTLEQSVKALKQGGTACLVGFLTQPKPVDVLMGLITQAKILKGIAVFSRAMLARIVDLTEEHDLHPYLGKVFEWEEAPEAFELLRKQDTVGKIVIRV